MIKKMFIIIFYNALFLQFYYNVYLKIFEFFLDKWNTIMKNRGYDKWFLWWNGFYTCSSKVDLGTLSMISEFRVSMMWSDCTSRTVTAVCTSLHTRGRQITCWLIVGMPFCRDKPHRLYFHQYCTVFLIIAC